VSRTSGWNGCPENPDSGSSGNVGDHPGAEIVPDTQPIKRSRFNSLCRNEVPVSIGNRSARGGPTGHPTSSPDICIINVLHPADKARIPDSSSDARRAVKRMAQQPSLHEAAWPAKVGSIAVTRIERPVSAVARESHR
jgi:hypothetical protein